MNALCPVPRLEAAAQDADTLDAALHARLRSMLSAAVYGAWFTRLQVLSVDDVAILSVPTPFLVSWLRRHHGDTLRAAMTAVAPMVADVVLKLRATGVAAATREPVAPEQPLPVDGAAPHPRLAPVQPSQLTALDERVPVDPWRGRIAVIQDLVARHYGIERAEMLSSRRTAEVVRPRQVAMYLAKTLTPHSFLEIGRRFGRDHATVLHAVRKIEKLASRGAAFAAELHDLRQGLEPSMSVVLFPRRPAPRSTIPGERAAHDLAAEFEVLVRARAAGVDPAEPDTLRAVLVRLAARALLEIDDVDQRAAP